MRSLPLWKPLAIAAVALYSLLYALPSLLGGVSTSYPSWLPDKTISQGLDLQGGLYLLLEVDTDKAVEQAAENRVDEIRGALREKKLRYRGVAREGRDAVRVRPSASVNPDEVKTLLAERFPEMSATDDGDGMLLTLVEQEQKDVRGWAVEQSIQTIRSRIDQFGVAEPTIQKQGEKRILVQLPGLSDPDRAKDLIGRTARLEFKLVNEKGDLEAALDGKMPPGSTILYEEETDKTTGKTRRIPYLMKKRTVLSGDMLQDARVNIDQQYGEVYVLIIFDSKGKRKFASLTKENVNKRMAIVLDDKVYSAPVIREPILGGRAQITGNFTTEEAHDLAIVLRAGALPAPVKILEERTVGPTLGKDSVEQGLASILIGGALVLVFMVLYYKSFGLLANLAVIFNILILMAVLAAMQATLTLPGIAGAVLLLGMAVDANVLIFERIREEINLGKTPLAAIDHGYSKAFSTIIDANITTLITALVLFQFGTGPVKGFAVTLSIGLLASMFTAIFVTRVMLTMILKNKRPKALSI